MILFASSAWLAGICLALEILVGFMVMLSLKCISMGPPLMGRELISSLMTSANSSHIADFSRFISSFSALSALFA